MSHGHGHGHGGGGSAAGAHRWRLQLAFGLVAYGMRQDAERLRAE